MKGKGKDKKESGGRQTTLFGLPSVPAPEKEKKVVGRKKKTPTAEAESQLSTTVSEETQITEDSQMTEVDEPMNPDDQKQQAPQVTAEPAEGEEDEEPIDWPDSPVGESSTLVDVGA